MQGWRDCFLWSTEPSRERRAGVTTGASHQVMQQQRSASLSRAPTAARAWYRRRRPTRQRLRWLSLTLTSARRRLSPSHRISSGAPTKGAAMATIVGTLRCRSSHMSRSWKRHLRRPGSPGRGAIACWLASVEDENLESDITCRESSPQRTKWQKDDVFLPRDQVNLMKARLQSLRIQNYVQFDVANKLSSSNYLSPIWFCSMIFASLCQMTGIRVLWFDHESWKLMFKYS